MCMQNRNIAHSTALETYNAVHIPRALVTYPFLQHSGLTPGQKRYLYTADEAYGRDHVRKLIQQHYLNVIHRAVRTGARSPEWPSMDAEFTTNLQADGDQHQAAPELQHSSKPRKKHSAAKANRQKPDVTSGSRALVLPKISPRKSLMSRFPESNVRRSNQTMKRRKDTSTRPVRTKADVEWDVMEEDSLLTGISSLSLSEEFSDIM